MEPISKLTNSEIAQIFASWNGKRIWGGLLSVAYFSIEIGDQWKSPKQETYGKFTLLISCPWLIRAHEKVVFTHEIQDVEEQSMQAQQFFNNKIIDNASLDLNNHSLLITTNSNENLLISPTEDEEDQGEWTLFYVVPPKDRYWYTFDGSVIKYND